MMAIEDMLVEAAQEALAGDLISMDVYEHVLGDDGTAAIAAALEGAFDEEWPGCSEVLAALEADTDASASSVGALLDFLILQIANNAYDSGAMERLE